MTRVDYRNHYTGRVQGGHDGAFIAACGFADDVHGSQSLQPTHQGAVALRVVGKLTELRAGSAGGVQIQGEFGDIHSDVDDRWHG